MSEYIRKVNRGYQFTLPQSFRDNYHLQIGDYLRIFEDNGKLIVEPVDILSRDPSRALEALFDSFSKQEDDLSEAEIMEMVRSEIKKHRKTRTDRRKN